ncbi:Protocadherin gamma-A4 [Chelonia mydas]|uniref:Protocadherin gamma-A4 n=1 Tax=Chelonia mydas TaxID=8469 RepID=M7C4F0_CHEMY|nr:Protocadherin gamma-A4 [Chelonia mydas]
MKKGSFVANIAKDLELDVKQLSDSGVHIVSGGKTQYFALDFKSGHLYITERIDREQICGLVEKCVLNCEVIVEDKMKLFPVEVEITDINDNAPSFQSEEFDLKISETAAPGSRFSVRQAEDPDMGLNSIQSYQLSSNTHFLLDVETRSDGIKYAELVLEKCLDREEQAVHKLILTATDGGDPVRSGTAQIRVIVLDSNDNAPVFSQPVYRVTIWENVPEGSPVVTVKATDPDEGVNKEVKYSFQKITDKASKMFHLDPKTGEITVVGKLDFEEAALYETEVQAHDVGGLFDKSKIIIVVSDVNDNAPKIALRSLISSIPEDSPTGTVIALLNVQDPDSGENGEVTCSTPSDLPFQLKKPFENYYSLVTDRALDREQVAAYNITVTATDNGTPPLSTATTIQLRILDTNDNYPLFDKTSYTGYVTENNPRGVSVFSLRASDPDWGENARVTYSIIEGDRSEVPLSSSISINSETGALYALRSFDYEQFREIRFQVQAQDGGSPPLSSNVSVTLFILDQNDNSPHILHPSFPTDGSTGVELAPRSSEPGYLVTKVVAVDADSGQNAWLSYQLLKATEPGLFSVGLHSGEIRTARSFVDKDALKQSLVVLVKDNGQPPLSATATVTVVVADSIPEILSDLSSLSAPADPQSSLTLYLVIAVASVSCLFFTFILVLLALRLRRWRNSQLFDSSSVTFSGVPVSQFVGIDGVRAFLHSYSHESSLTTDCGKSQFNVPKSNYPNTLTSQQTYEIKNPILMTEELYINKGDQTCVQFREIRFQVQAQDGGSPPLSSNVSVTLFILDQNDNSPHILHPSFPTDGSTGVELAPRSSEPGYLVTKVVAVDADSGQNAWLSYQLLKATEPGLFSVGLHSGEIRTARSFVDKDALKQSLVVLVKDNGQPPLSATATVTVVVADSIPEILSDLSSLSAPADLQSSLTLYLVIAVASISCLFFTFILVLLALRLRRWRNSQLFDSSSVTFSGVPVSQFAGIDGVRAFLHSYSHEVSLTTDSRKSKFNVPRSNYSNSVTSQQTYEIKNPILMTEELYINKGDQTCVQVS